MPEPIRPYGISSDAKPILTQVFGEEAVQDARIDALELERAEMTVDAMTAAGIKPGKNISAKAGNVLLARWVAESSIHRPSDAPAELAPDVLKKALEHYGKTAEKFSKKKQHREAFAAWSSLAALAQLPRDPQLKIDVRDEVLAQAATKAWESLVAVAAARPGHRETIEGLQQRLLQAGWRREAIDNLVALHLGGTKGTIDCALGNLLALPGLLDHLEAMSLPIDEESVLALLEATAPWRSTGRTASGWVAELATAMEQIRGLGTPCPVYWGTLLRVFGEVTPTAGSGTEESGPLPLSDALVLAANLAATRGNVETVRSQLEALQAKPGPLAERVAATNQVLDELRAGLAGYPGVAGNTTVTQRLLQVINASESAAEMRQAGALFISSVRELLALEPGQEVVSAFLSGLEKPELEPKLLADKLAACVRASRNTTLGTSESSTELANCVARAVGSGQLPPEAAPAFVERVLQSWTAIADPSEREATIRVTMEYLVGRWDYYSNTTRGFLVRAHEQGLTDPTALANSLSFLTQLRSTEGAALTALVDVGIELNGLDLSNLPQRLAAAVNLAAEQGRPTSGVVAAINSIHDFDGRTTHTDRLRTETIQQLSAKATLQLLTTYRSEFYPTTFRQLTDRMVASLQGSDWVAWFRETDPEGRATLSYFSNLAEFSLLNTALPAAELLFDGFIRGGNWTSTVLASANHYMPFFLTAWPRLTPEHRRAVEEKLLASAQKGDANAAYLVRYLFEHNAALAPDLRGYAQGLPAIPTPRPRTEPWREDGVITAKAFFYPDEQWFETTYRELKRPDRGFVLDTAYMSEHHYDRKKTLVLIRQRPGALTERIILTCDPEESRAEALSNKEVDIVVHRGHCFHLLKTFPTDATVSTQHPKLLIGGSCWSLGTMSGDDFLQKYGEFDLISDRDTGEGAVNDAVLLKIMSAAANAPVQDWSGFGLAPYVKNRGIVLPSDPIFLIGRWKIAFKEQQAG